MSKTQAECESGVPDQRTEALAERCRLSPSVPRLSETPAGGPRGPPPKVPRAQVKEVQKQALKGSPPPPHTQGPRKK